MSHIMIRAASQTDTSNTADGTAGGPKNRNVGQRKYINYTIESQMNIVTDNVIHVSHI